MPSIFSKIVAGEIPSHKIAETENCLAFLDVFPLVKGHTLVIPKREVDYIFDLPTDLYTELNLFAKDIATAIKKVIPCTKIGIAVVGIEVPHAHIHLIPINGVGDMNFSKPKLQLTKEQMVDIAQKISQAFVS